MLVFQECASPGNSENGANFIIRDKFAALYAVISDSEKVKHFQLTSFRLVLNVKKFNFVNYFPSKLEFASK